MIGNYSRRIGSAFYFVVIHYADVCSCQSTRLQERKMAYSRVYCNRICLLRIGMCLLQRRVLLLRPYNWIILKHRSTDMALKSMAIEMPFYSLLQYCVLDFFYGDVLSWRSEMYFANTYQLVQSPSLASGIIKSSCGDWYSWHRDSCCRHNQR